MKKIKLLALASMLLMLASYQNCSMVAAPEVEDATEATSTAGLSSESQLEANAFKVLRNRCASCHNPDMPSGGIDFITSKDELLFYQFVVPGEPQLSPLYQSMTGSEGMSFMPPTGSLKSAEIKAVSDWIQDGFKNGTGGITPPPPPPTVLMPTFASINTLIIRTKCLGCHNSNNSAGGVSYGTYAQLLNTVQPGNLNASSLYVRTANGTMPPGQPLSANEVSAIQMWITNGAPNN